ncbi:RsbR, positive regulator of sigma-B [Bacillus sp. JCM 19046]|nr:RsbR, positive regulator of sigma-B [Bacillus sp. JCM 19045]GAF16943.1 RsbR, positive regulator of sigma-B [Bacillus sp. JCM 19046]
MLYDFLKSNTRRLTDEWYDSLDKSKEGVYGSTNPDVITTLKNQNHEFHVIFCEIFNEDRHTSELEAEFSQWIDKLAKDQQHLATPVPEMIEEFLNVQEQYLDLISEYSETHKDQVSFAKSSSWNRIVTKALKEVIVAFSRANLTQSEIHLQAQKEMITELSAPVIKLSKNIALLPLVGEIDTHRAQVIFSQTMEQCVQLQVDSLLIDLSGVPIVDTMVANQIFSLIEGLKLIGVKASLSGVRPEIAQTSVQLGIDFMSIPIYSSIERALVNQMQLT